MAFPAALGKQKQALRSSGRMAILVFLFGVIASAQPAISKIADLRKGQFTGPALVRLQGVVTGFSGWKNSFFLQDETGAISVDRLEVTALNPGDKVIVTGECREGLYAPIVVSHEIQVLSHGDLPPPQVTDYAEIASGTYDSRLIELTGIVHRAHTERVWGKSVLLLDVHADGVPIVVHVLNSSQSTVDNLIDSTIRVKGICGTIFNDRKQLIGVRLFVSNLGQISVVRPATDAFRLPIASLAALLRFGGPSADHRVRVTGTVTYQDASNQIYIQQGDAAARIQSIQSGAWKPGTWVDAAGFLSDDGSLPTLRNAVIREVGFSDSPVPTKIAANDVIRNEDGFVEGRYNGRLVTLDAYIIDVLPSDAYNLWSVRSGKTGFQVQLARSAGFGDLIFEPGSHVKLTGICVIEEDRDRHPVSFRILLRSPVDIQILAIAHANDSLVLLLIVVLLILLGSLFTWSALPRDKEEKLRTEKEVTLIRQGRRVGIFHRLLSFLSVCLGGFIAAAWLFGFFKPRDLEISSTVTPNAGLGILLMGAAVWLAGTRRFQSYSRTQTIFSALAGAMGLVTLVEYLTSRDLLIDRLLIRNMPAWSNGAQAGRMAVGTALSLVLLSASLSVVTRKRFAGFGQVLAIATGAVSLLNLIGKIYGDQAKYGVGAHATMALPTAAALVGLSLAVLLLRPEWGLVKTVFLTGTGGLMARRLLPLAVICPVLLGWIRLQGQVAGLYGTRFGLALFALSNVLCFGFLIWSAAAMLNRLDSSRSRAEAEARERERRLNASFASAAVGDWTWDVTRDEITAHPVVWDLYGEPGHQGAEPAAWFTNRQHPEDAAYIALELGVAIECGSPLDIEFRVVHPSGKVLWLACRATITRDEDGNALRVDGVNFDVTDRKNAEMRVRESEERFRQLADSMPQIVWTAKPDGTIDYYNQRWYEYTDTSFGAPWQESVHPDDRESTEKALMRSVQDGTIYEHEVRVKQASTQSFRWHLGRSNPIRNAQGQIERWFGTATDIDEFKRASAELQALNEHLEDRVEKRSAQLAESEQRHRMLVEAVKDYAIYMLDPQGVVATWNTGAERLKGYSASEILGQPFATLFGGDDAGAEASQVLETAAVHGRTEVEGWRHRKDGSSFWGSVLVTAIHDRTALRGYSIIVRDMTEQKTAEQLLISEQKRSAEANRAKSSFLAAMSHEIRTPMNAILGMADLLWETELSRAQREYVRRFRGAGHNLLTLINDILDLTKIESGHFELESIDFDLPDLLERTVELMLPRAKAKGIDLQTQSGPNLPHFVSGDPGRLQQILYNLVGNAIKFTEQGHVTLETSVHSDGETGHLQFAVSDTGIGIPADKITAIFEDFTQAESSTTRRFGGTGLGLGISRRLVSRMGGELTVRSVFGQGSTFRFDVSLGIGKHPVELTANDSVDLSCCRVLIVDDNSTNRLILDEMCAGWGLQTSDVSEVDEAVILARRALEQQQPFSVVLLDRVMPGTDGIEAMHQLQAIDPNLPIIVISSDQQPGDVTKAKALGATAYVTKPVRGQELLSLISNACRSNQGSTCVPHPGKKKDSRFNGADKKNLKILVAEDSENNRFLVSEYLKNRPYELTFVENGSLAVEAWAQGQFDLILMDMQMPVMDGLASTAAIRALEQERSAKRTPILALTANALLEDIEKSRAAGCDAHVSKPVSRERLIAAIEEHRSDHATGNMEVNTMTKTSHYEIAIPEGFEAISRGYIASCQRQLEQLRDLASSGQDVEQLRIFGHDMKGTGTSFGFPDLSALGASIEDAAKAANMPVLTEKLSAAKEYVDYALKTLG